MLWNAVAVFDKGVEKTVMNYKAAKKNVKGHNLEKISGVNFKTDSFVGDSYIGDQRRRKLKTKLYNNNDSKIDTKFGREGVKMRNIGGVGSKYMNSYMDRDGFRNDINDL